jgi:transcriptional regulator with AAA-type ATPase domain
MLVEHPALPEPLTATNQHEHGVDIDSLGRRDRCRIAAQLVAVTALLAEFELWPGRWAVRATRVEAVDGGFRALLPTLPLPLSSIWSRLGGGDTAGEVTRNAILGEVERLTGLDLVGPGVGLAEPGFFLDGALARLLDELGSPIDIPTARSLWMWRWSLPKLPDPGDTDLLAVGDVRVARRLGAALWSAAVRGGRGSVLDWVEETGKSNRVAQGRGSGELRIVAGSLDEETVGDLAEGSMDRAHAILALGLFPPGWNPVSELLHDPNRLHNHLAVVGLSPAKRRGLAESLSGRFDPFAVADRTALTESASSMFTRSGGRGTTRFAELVRVAGLAPEGVPVERALELSGFSLAELERAKDARDVLVRDGRVMLPTAGPLVIDPRHAELTDDFEQRDPRRLLHGALASGDTGALLRWARRCLDDLDAVSVRRLLSTIAPGSLGAGVQAMLVESCLYLADIHGARCALNGLPDRITTPWSRWMDLLDRGPGRTVELPGALEVKHAPRACAEIALVQLRRALEGDLDMVPTMVDFVRQTMDHLEGANRRWVEIRLAAKVSPERLLDADWRRSSTRGHPELVGLIMFERSLRATFERDFGAARRLLRRLLDNERSPGRRAFMKLNLGYVEGEDGRYREAEALTAAAYRLFQAAGFRYRIWDPLYNLAVADIDQLRVDRAATRLDALAEINDSLFVAVERARLALANGRLDELRSRLDVLPEPDETIGGQVIEAVSFLHGAAALLHDTPAAALPLLKRGGEEGKLWIALAEAISGPTVPAPVDGTDDWGVGKAAELAVRLRNADHRGRQWLDGLEPSVVTDAMAIALCHRLGVRPGWPPAEVAVRASETLAEAGLAGWAESLRWRSSEVEGLLSGLSRLIRHRGPEPGKRDGFDDVLARLGLGGLLVVSANDGSELLRVGHGPPGQAVVQGPLEFIPLGSDPVAGAGWQLLIDLLGVVYPMDDDVVVTGRQSEVRVDGVSAAVVRLRDEIQRAAVPRFTVLIQGETGSGKELVAREIHRLSGREGQLVSVNIAAVPEGLLEAELFGSLKGAFTGADRSRRGLVAAADGGTLFLDEVGDLDVALQVKLLRFLESGEVRAVGSDRTRELDVRVICATHRNLDRRVREGRFREDLFYRIAVARVRVPPLRERREDIPVLKAIFEREAARHHGVLIGGWTGAAERMLMNHRWPGNIRELKHTIEFALARAGGRRLRPEHLPFAAAEPPMRGTWQSSLAAFKRGLLTDVLGRHLGNRSAAARELGISRQALLYQIKTLGLKEL